MVNTRSELATIAMLQTHLDRGQDYLELFVPLALECVGAHDPDGRVTSSSLQGQLEQDYGIRLSVDVAQVLLNKCRKRGALKRVGGTFLRDERFQHGPRTIDQALDDTVQRYIALGAELAAFLRAEYDQGINDDDAARLLVDFLSRHQVPILIGGDLDGSLRGISVATGNDRRVARFIIQEIDRNPTVRPALATLLQGIVVRQSVQLETVTHTSSRLVGRITNSCDKF